MGAHEPEDPQQHEDEEVKQRRPEETEDDGRDEIIRRWLRYAASERCHAARLRAEHDQPFDQLRDTRAAARAGAAEVLAEATDFASAADRMMAEVRRVYVRVPPLLGFDEAMLSYTSARTWQACARELIPDLPEIQPRWSQHWVDRRPSRPSVEPRERGEHHSPARVLCPADA